MITPPKTIIELDVELTQEEKNKLIKLLSNEDFFIDEKHIRVYRGKEYIFESEYSNIIYEEHAKENAYRLEY